MGPRHRRGAGLRIKNKSRARERRRRYPSAVRCTDRAIARSVCECANAIRVGRERERDALPSRYPCDVTGGDLFRRCSIRHVYAHDNLVIGRAIPRWSLKLTFSQIGGGGGGGARFRCVIIYRNLFYALFIHLRAITGKIYIYAYSFANSAESDLRRLNVVANRILGGSR